MTNNRREDFPVQERPMSDDQNLFTSGSVQTFIATAFILALMATGIATYNVARSGQIESAVLDLRIEQTRLMKAESKPSKPCKSPQPALSASKAVDLYLDKDLD
jgi:hypothetical protein